VIKRHLSLGLTIAALVLFAAVALTPSGASAANGQGGFAASLGVHHGYRIRLSTRGRQVEVEILKDGAYQGNGQFVAIYAVRGQVSPRSLRADLGPFGKIDARFDETSRSGGKPESFGTCHYHSELFLRGRLRGTIRIRGEGGFVRFGSRSVPAHFDRTFPESKGCRSTSTEGGEESLKAAAASASDSEGFYKAIVISYGHDGPRHTFFEDESFYPAGGDGAEAKDERSSLDAGYRERRGRVAVLEHTFFDASAKFDLEEFEQGHVRATLAPPPPFTGTAIFTQDGKNAAPSLAGPLAISLPGAPGVRLTGPRNIVDLCTKEAEFRCYLERPPKL
jgi:hypothetical protein